jgi:aminopeptidase YwaD
MQKINITSKAEFYLDTLCAVKPNRRTGSPGNREAVHFFGETLRSFGYGIDVTPFSTLDYLTQGAYLAQGEESFEVFVSPYSLPCELTSGLVVVSRMEELERVDCTDQILLLHGEICSEQIMPKNFEFYNPEHHQHMIALLEHRRPAALITATGSNPDQVGALNPYPLFVDGDFDIPSVYCEESLGELLVIRQGTAFQLKIEAKRIPAQASNVIARLNHSAGKKIVFTAHIDAYQDSPGATDNASGCVVLLLLGELLAGYQGPYEIEIAAFNGEDHYSVGGQMDYLQRYGEVFSQIMVVVNIDDVGYQHGRSSFSFYEVPESLSRATREAFLQFPGLIPGDAWYSGDHMIFVQKNVPAIALTSEWMPELMKTVTHTHLDTPDLVNCSKLVELSEALESWVKSLPFAL